MDGMMPVDELKARLSLPDLPAEGSYHTLAGLLLALLRRVPRRGRPHRVRRLAVRGAGDGWPARRQGARQPRAGGGGVSLRATTVRQCAVLVGGLGTRLGALTERTPKPFLPCGDRPFLAWLLREFVRFGVDGVPAADRPSLGPRSRRASRRCRRCCRAQARIVMLRRAGAGRHRRRGVPCARSAG